MEVEAIIINGKKYIPAYDIDCTGCALYEQCLSLEIDTNLVPSDSICDVFSNGTPRGLKEVTD